MTEKNKLRPETVRLLSEEAVKRYHEGLPPPDNISDLYEWMEDEGFDEVLKVSEDTIGISIDELATEQFNDRNLRDWLGVPTSHQINDDQRIEFIIERISEEGGGSLGEYDFPSVLKYPIAGENGRTALIGGYALMCGQGGPEFTWLGVFADEKQFYERLKGEGIRLPTELLTLPPTELLTWWREGRGR
jgi:hypothetical protein